MQIIQPFDDQVVLLLGEQLLHSVLDAKNSTHHVGIAALLAVVHLFRPPWKLGLPKLMLVAQQPQHVAQPHLHMLELQLHAVQKPQFAPAI